MDIKKYNIQKKVSLRIRTNTPENPLGSLRKMSCELIGFPGEKNSIDKFVIDQKKSIYSRSPSKSINDKKQPSKKVLVPPISMTESEQRHQHPASFNLLPILDPTLEFLKPHHSIHSEAFQLFSNSPLKIRINKKIISQDQDQASSPYLRKGKPSNPEITPQRHPSLPSLKKIEAPIVKSLSKNKKKDSHGLLKYLHEIKIEQDIQIQKLRHHSKLPIRAIHEFDNNFQQKIQNSMLESLKLKQNVYKT